MLRSRLPTSCAYAGVMSSEVIVPPLGGCWNAHPAGITTERTQVRTFRTLPFVFFRFFLVSHRRAPVPGCRSRAGLAAAEQYEVMAEHRHAPADRALGLGQGRRYGGVEGDRPLPGPSGRR